METQNVKQYKDIVGGGELLLNVTPPADGEAPARLAARLKGDEATVLFVYNFLTDEFYFKIVESINKDNSYLVNSLEAKVREIAADVLVTYAVDIVAIREAVILENITPEEYVPPTQPEVEGFTAAENDL